MESFEALVAGTYASLGRKRPSLVWAKFEMLLGLGAASIGIVMGSNEPVWRAASAALITLGAYLALAGHRTHLYDAMTRQTALRERARAMSLEPVRLSAR
jgi:hypothetical protein